MDNGESTFDLCSLANGNLIRSFTFRSRDIECRLPLQVAFANEGRYVVGGSDHGVVYVYDRKTAQLFDTLHHALDDEAVVQTVSVSKRSCPKYIANDSLDLRLQRNSLYIHRNIWKEPSSVHICMATSS